MGWRLSSCTFFGTNIRTSEGRQVLGKEIKLILIIAVVSLIVTVAYVQFSNVVVAG